MLIFKRYAQSSDSKAWMLTLTDLVALMLTFFVMLYSMMALEEQKWHALRESFRGRLNIVDDSRVVAPRYELDLKDVAVEMGIDLDYLATLMRHTLPDYPALAGTLVRRGADRVVISLPGGRMFQPGSAQPIDDAREAISAIGGLLRQIGNAVIVAGHADPTGSDDQANWNLSLARAAQVAALLRNAGYEVPITVTGHGASRFDDLPADLPREQRLSLARRTDIVILEHGGRGR